MAWTGYVRLDPDKTDVGTAEAVWNEGQADEFRYGPVRARLNIAGRDAFVAAAEAAKAAHDTRMAQEASFSANLTNALNA